MGTEYESRTRHWEFAVALCIFPFLATAATLVTISKHCGIISNPLKAAIVRVDAAMP